MQKPVKIILGIDPGTLVAGFGLINVEGKSLSLRDMGVIKLSVRKDAYQRLQIIHQTLRELIEKHKPDSLAIEAPFFGKNVQSMLKLGRAQGVAIATAMSAGLDVYEYSPRKIKQAITGNGNADKEQVWKMLQRQLHMPDRPALFDATDAVAVALCHYYETQGSLPAALPATTGKKKKGWDAFLQENAHRIIKK
ncbi:MAG TPA: crossover junction endodeoxyribonuclease RuvC [Chitinophagaceae bacterium]|nr:crossover junction endodeoxyribonuclease RuvC [Chitinophagaceae bacterium]